MSRKPRRESMDLVVVDATKLKYHIRRKSISTSQFADEMDVGRTSIYRMLGGTAVKRTKVQSLADELHIPIEDLLPTEVEACSDEWFAASQHPEWEIVPGSLMALRPMSNSLVMRVAKVRHRVLPSEYGRAKIYDIAGMPSAVREQCREALSRHAAVCRKLEGCPHIAKNLTMTASPDESIWTSVDAWFESETLSVLVAEESLSTKPLHAVMRHVVNALSTLHQNQMVARELHPGCILVSREHQAMITDLELAKLLEVEGTVSADWQRNDYRAPEVPSGRSHPQADLYSFARIFLHAATGNDLEEVDEIDLLEATLPKGKLRDELSACLSPIWQDRPESIADIQTLLA